jgi:hypothetical protein
MSAFGVKFNLGRAARLGAAFGAILLSGAGAAHAGVTGLYNTGVDVGANKVDQAWSIVTSFSDPSLPIGSPAYADTTNGIFPIGPWVPNSTKSSWITPFNPVNSNTDPSHFGLYGYVTQFNISGTVAASNSLSLLFASDDKVASIVLNGVALYSGPTDGSSQYTSFTPFVLSDALKSGTNTLDFFVMNYPRVGGNPSGLNVEFTGITGVPEVSTWAMLLIGFVGLGFAGYRKSKGERTAFVAA